MASRLQYSQRGFERALSMASASLTCLVEGIDDIYFYQQIVEDYFSRAAVVHRFEIRTPREVQAAADGKRALIEVFRQLRSRKKLRIGTATGHKTLVFIADKDYDDISRKKLRSPHFFYTPGVCVENSAYEACDMKACVEAVLGRRLPEPGFLPAEDFRSWKHACAMSWREWIIYCVLCEISGVAPRKNRSGPSRMHVGDPPALDATRFDQLIGEFKIAIGDDAAFRKFFRQAETAVDRAIRDGRVDDVFCGKWYPHFLRQAASRLGAPYSTRASDLADAKLMRSHVVRSLSFSPLLRAFFAAKFDAVLA